MDLKSSKYIYFGFLFIAIGFSGLFMPAILGSLFINDSFEPVAFADLPSFEQQFVNPNQEALINESLNEVEYPGVSDRLIISKGEINMPVFFGDNESILEKGGWLYHHTSKPEIGGNTVIFGHRFKYLPPISNTLYNLDKVEVGDVMILIWQGKEYRYEVFETKIIEPTDLSVIQPSSDSILTVITCTPLFSTKQRLVVTGRLI